MSRTGTTQWRRVTAIVRREGRLRNAPCGICHGKLGPIDYRTQGEADKEARAAGSYWLVGAQRPLALDVDHVISHANGGQDNLENAAPSHAVCNRSAGAKGAPKRTTNQPINGHWWPLNGTGQPLPGRALPGTRTPTHEFRP